MKNDKNFTPKSGPIQYDMRGTRGAGGTPARTGRASIIGTSGNAMTHDEVIGGGHMISVQDEGLDEFSRFNIAQEHGLAQNESKSIYGEQGTKTAFEDNFGRVPEVQNSVSPKAKIYGNADFERKMYGDFKPESSVSDNGEETNSDSNKTDEIDEKKDRAVAVGDGDKVIKTIVIAGQIEGHTQLPQEQKATRYEELIPQLVEIEESDKISGLLLILNTVGGDVEAGLALSEMIAGMKKPTASLVLGGGHSIGVPLAVAAKRSFIVPSATMTLHPVRVTGMVLSAPQTYVYLNNMQQRIVDFVCSHCKMSSKRFNELMLAREEMSTDLGSVLDGKKAVDEGLIDELGTLEKALRFLKSSQ